MPFYLLFYKAPWTTNANTFVFFQEKNVPKSPYELAICNNARATAFVGVEILKGFATSPPSPRKLGGELARGYLMNRIEKSNRSEIL
jgi:hypothetical protein